MEAMAQEVSYKTSHKTDIDNLLKKRKSDALLVYITGDKKPVKNFGTLIHPEVLPLFYEHLKLLGKKKKVSLLLYTTGGALETPWALVNLIREYCGEFEVLVPSKALSAGTLISLGADVIGTTPMTLLSPVDPTGNFVVEGKKRSVQVEDVVGFIEFAKERVGLKKQEFLVEILKSLSSDTPPQVLGSIHRTHALIRLLVEKLLSLRKSSISETQKNSIKENLTKKLYSHRHLINRKELLEIGFKGIAEKLTEEQENNLLNIFNYFSKKMKLYDEFDPDKKLGSKKKLAFSLPRAVISSKKLTHVFVSEYTIEKQDAGPGKSTIFLNVKNLGWVKKEV